MEDIIKAPVHTGEIKGVTNAPIDYPIFKGAVYYKCVSSKDMWMGMEAIIKLPEFSPDESRYEMFTDSFGTYKRYSDTPSVYLGGSSDFETDIGFGFFRGIINGEISKEKITFRPFWRSVYMENGEEQNTYNATGIYQNEFYFYPGDLVKVHLVCLEEDYLTFRVELLKGTEISPYKECRQTHDNKILLVEKIIAPGNGVRDTEYKHVNAIDQYHNEGRPTQETKAKAVNAFWQDVYLLREIDGIIKKIPFEGKMRKQIFAPSNEWFKTSIEDTKEFVTIGNRK